MLKGDMTYDRSDSEVSFYMDEEAERGCLVVYDTGADVAQPALDDADNLAIVPAGTAGIPIGILMDTVIDIDLTRHDLWHSRREVAIGDKVEIIRKGWFVTDQVDTGGTYYPGAAAYWKAGGLFTSDSGSLQVGRFESDLDSNNFVRIRLDI